MTIINQCWQCLPTSMQLLHHLVSRSIKSTPTYFIRQGTLNHSKNFYWTWLNVDARKALKVRLFSLFSDM